MFEDILKTLVTAMLPILEIRGAIPVGVAAGMDPWTAFAIGFVGNMLPVPFLILLARKVIEWMKKHHILDKLTTFVERKGKERPKPFRHTASGGFLYSLLYLCPEPAHGRARSSRRCLICALKGRCLPSAWALPLPDL